jgi:hypothetical protein
MSFIKKLNRLCGGIPYGFISSHLNYRNIPHFTQAFSKKSQTYYDTITSFTSDLKNRTVIFQSDLQNITTEINQILIKHRYDTNKLRIVTIIISLMILFLCWRTIKSYISTETSDIANKTMNDEEFIKNVYRLSDQILVYLQTDPKAQEQITRLLQICVENASKNKQFMKALEKLGSDLITSKSIEDSSNQLGNAVITTQLNDKTNKDSLAKIFYDAAISALSKFRPW